MTNNFMPKIPESLKVEALGNSSLPHIIQARMILLGHRVLFGEYMNLAGIYKGMLFWTRIHNKFE